MYMIADKSSGIHITNETLAEISTKYKRILQIETSPVLGSTRALVVQTLSHYRLRHFPLLSAGIRIMDEVYYIPPQLHNIIL